MKLYYKEDQGNRVLYSFLGISFFKTKPNYVSFFKKILLRINSLQEQNKVLKDQVDYLKKHSEITLLKKADGDLRNFQLRLLDFYVELEREFEKNGIESFIIAGNLIGAVRHKGFIPWDDDIDVGMIRSNYVKFLDYCKKNFIEIDSSKLDFSKKDYEENFYFLIIDYLNEYPNTNLFMRYWGHTMIFRGTSLFDLSSFDVFPYDYYDDLCSYEEHLIHFEKVIKQAESISNYNRRIDFIINKNFEYKNIVEKSNTIYYGLDNTVNQFVHSHFFKAEKLFPLKKLRYENYQVNVPNDEIYWLDNEVPSWRDYPPDIGYSHHVVLLKKYQEKYNKLK